MDILPLEIQINILSFICPNQDISLNHLYLKLFRCNYIWGPIVWERFKISKSCNFFEEFKILPDWPWVYPEYTFTIDEKLSKM